MMGCGQKFNPTKAEEHFLNSISKSKKIGKLIASFLSIIYWP
jgi:hypothetical protein